MSAPPQARETPGAYVHFPFCASRCSYCDFPTVAGLPRQLEPVFERAQRDGLVEREGPLVRLTRFGRLHSNTLFAELHAVSG